MAKAKKETGLRGLRGKAGRVGPAGPKGPPGNHTKEIARLSAQMDQVVRELQVQLSRIAQIQAQLDRLGRGQSIHPDAPEHMDREDN